MNLDFFHFHMSVALERAQLLLELGRCEDAAREVCQHLSQAPNDLEGHYLLTFCLIGLNRICEAEAEANTAIHLSPDSPLGFHAVAIVMYIRSRFADAIQVLTEAIRLDPNNVDYRALFAECRFEQGRWKDAKNAAEGGLAIDPRSERCMNLRAMSLVKLGRRDEAGKTLMSSLYKNPENASTHANMGWALLHAGRPGPAQEFFLESLRLNPESQSTRAGNFHAILSRNPLYRLLLTFFLWMGRLSIGVKCALIFGFFFLAQAIIGATQNAGRLASHLWLALGVSIGLRLIIWSAYPLLNLILRLFPPGKYVLSSDGRWGPIIVGACWGGFFLFGGISARTKSPWAIIASITFLAVSFPVAGIFHCERGYPRKTMAGITLGLLALGLAAAGLVVVSDAIAWAMLLAVLLGVIASGWIAKSLASAQPRR